MLVGQLKRGVVLVSESSQKYEVGELLGSGGQGEVYVVERGNKKYALKWYYPHTATAAQKKILDRLITAGSPDASFLWPQDLIYNNDGKSFGYIMPLRSKNYKSIVDLMKRRAEPSFSNLCRAAINLTKGYKSLHDRGFSYRDISFGNVFFNPDNGDVLICDNDNVAPNSSMTSDEDVSVYGTPRFMAPEIVRGEAKPSRNTDLFSLAVLLFYMFMLGHPLDGEKEAKIKCMDTRAMRMLYGDEPVFVYDPVNKSNRPNRDYHSNVIIYWNLYPKALKDMFTVAFTVGLKNANKRVTEGQWLDVLSNLMASVLHCKCGAENFYDVEKVNLHFAPTCWNCGNTIPVNPLILCIDNRHKLPIIKTTNIYSHHINGDLNWSEKIAEFVQNPNNPTLWGVKNCTNATWIYIRSDGLQTPVPPGKAASIIKGAQINFGKVTGVIQ